MPQELDRLLLEAALNGLEAHKARIEEYIAAVRFRLGLRGPRRPRHTEPLIPLTPTHGERRLSSAGRQAIIDASKKRWAAVRAQQHVGAARPRRNMSAAAKKRIAAAQKKRWAAFRAKKAAEATAV